MQKATKDEMVEMRIIPLRLLLQEMGANADTREDIRLHRRKIKSRGYARTYRRNTKQLQEQKKRLMQEKRDLQREIDTLSSLIMQCRC